MLEPATRDSLGTAPSFHGHSGADRREVTGAIAVGPNATAADESSVCPIPARDPASARIMSA
jgi:hypothetical protein